MSSYQELISQREKLDQQIETAKAAEFDAVVTILKEKCRSMELHAPILAFSLAKAISYVLACALNPNITIRRIRKKNGRAAEKSPNGLLAGTARPSLFGSKRLCTRGRLARPGSCRSAFK